MRLPKPAQVGASRRCCPPPRCGRHRCSGRQTPAHAELWMSKDPAQGRRQRGGSSRQSRTFARATVHFLVRRRLEGGSHVANVDGRRWHVAQRGSCRSRRGARGLRHTPLSDCAGGHRKAGQRKRLAPALWPGSEYSGEQAGINVCCPGPRQRPHDGCAKGYHGKPADDRPPSVVWRGGAGSG